jgi:hypothetical protein
MQGLQRVLVFNRSVAPEPGVDDVLRLGGAPAVEYGEEVRAVCHE